MKTRKIIELIMAAALALGTLYACTNVKAEQPKEDAGTTDGNTEEPLAHDDSIVIAMENEPTTLNPYDHAAVPSGYMNQLTYNKLFRTDIDTLEPIPDLCDTYENVDDSTWLFTVKQGVKFHDGTELTAEDVKASMEYARNFTSASKYTSFWRSIEVVDTYTVKITTDGPYALILNDLTANGNTIVPKHLIDEGNDFSQNPIGTGPYKFVQWTLGDNLTFVKNEDYFDKDHMPTITNMIWRIIPEGSSRTIALETGEVDLVIDVDTADIERIKENPDINVIEKAGTRMSFMGINTERYPFDNLYFRKAISAAIDKEAVLTVATNGQGAVSMSPNPEVFSGATRENTIPYDPEQAQKYLDESGVDVTGLTFTCITYTDTTRRTAEVIQGYLAQIGVTMEIESMDFAAYLSNMLEGNFDAVIGGYTASDMLTYMKALWHSSSIGASNVPRVSDPEIDSLIDLALTQLDPAEKTATLEKVCARVNDQCLMISLYTSSVVRAYNSQLHGADVSASGQMLYQDLSWAE